ncbi:hypothetical protein B0H10DRAFT_2273493 [Mycena sp. CBHHK59/15]|nr:hypothetical protein B0H10DRAFT_2273493 [Mycena sp. CBHHK59/15]
MYGDEESSKNNTVIVKEPAVQDLRDDAKNHLGLMNTLGCAEQKRKREAKLLETWNVEGPEKYAPGIGLEADKTYYCPVGRTWERAGAMHLVHCWHQQGTATWDIITPSKDMIGNSGRATQVNAVYFTITEELAIIVAAYFKVLFPKYYDQYKEEFERGVWDRMDPGPFLGQAIIFKLWYTYTKMGWTVGQWCRSQRGTTWAVLCTSQTSTLSMAQHITPGRISTVFFCPEKTPQTLEVKPKNWNRDTAGGITAHPSLPGHSTLSTQPSTSDNTHNEDEDVQASPSSALSPAALAEKAKNKKRRTRMRAQRDSKNGETWF